MSAPLPGVSLADFIKQNEILLADAGIMVQVNGMFAAAIETEKAEWLAHILSVLCPVPHYQFHAIVDPMEGHYSNVCVLDMRLDVPRQLVGYALRAEDQPLLQQYITPE